MVWSKAESPKPFQFLAAKNSFLDSPPLQVKRCGGEKKRERIGCMATLLTCTLAQEAYLLLELKDFDIVEQEPI